jgi:uncharacterized membrane protein SpoIIM required for sporulation
MKELQFVARRSGDWEKWDRWLGARNDPGARSPRGKGAEKRPSRRAEERARADTMSAAELAPRFRALCHDLALAQDRNYSSELVDALQHRVLLAHQRLYSAKRRIGQAMLEFYLGAFPRAVRRERVVVLTSAALFFLPLVFILGLVQIVPESVYFLLSTEQIAQFEKLYALHPTAPLRTATTDWTMYAYYIGNNVKINFQCFAGGMLFGLGSVFYLLFNGLNIGAVAGHMTHMGLIPTFWGFVAGHSSFELLGIVFSGASGLKIGLALIAPGQRSRARALREAARQAVPLLYGAASMTFVAAFIEAFWSPLTLVPVEIKYGVGIALWTLLLAYFFLAGRSARPMPA